ncbi:unnamed protein product [Somion occarium]|uniref:Vomeronasal type-1 receptor n=1 Tax=Somion occarium TaxID=3059160 RepID=A0ABP1D0A8_9APHY
MSSQGFPLVELVDSVSKLGYLAAGVTAIWLWDFMIALLDYVPLFGARRMSLSDVAYIAARVSTAGFLIVILIQLVDASPDDCDFKSRAVVWFGAVAPPFNSLLFFLRVRAVFRESRVIVGVFALLWLSTFTTITVPLTSHVVSIEVIRMCSTSTLRSYDSVGWVTVAVFDTLVLIAISIRVLSGSMAVSRKERFRALLSGKGLGNVSRILLQTGQLYYLATVGVNITMAISIFTSASVPVQSGLSIIGIALRNMMACKVYRLLKLGLIESTPLATWTVHLPNEVELAVLPTLNVDIVHQDTGRTVDGRADGNKWVLNEFE